MRTSPGQTDPIHSSRQQHPGPWLTAIAILLATIPPTLPAQTPAKQPAASPLKFTLPEHDRYPESIAYDPVSRCYFLGSMSHSRILRIEEDGSYDEFVTLPTPELRSSIGMKVDAKRRCLWVCTGRFSLFADYDKVTAQTGVLRFDLDQGEQTGEWLLDQGSDYHIFNDLVVATNGDVFATTTLLGRIYRISQTSQKMQLLHQLPPGSHNNGIALGPDEKFLFLVVDRSISRLEIATRELVELRVPDRHALGADGLYFHRDSLVIVKPRRKQVCQLFLNQDFTAVQRVECLAREHPDFNYPTTGVLVGDKLVYVATSFADSARKPGSAAQHADVRIHELGLLE